MKSHASTANPGNAYCYEKILYCYEIFMYGYKISILWVKNIICIIMFLITRWLQRI